MSVCHIAFLFAHFVEETKQVILLKKLPKKTCKEKAHSSAYGKFDRSVKTNGLEEGGGKVAAAPPPNNFC